MDDPKESQRADDQTDTAAKTQKLPRLSDPLDQEKEAAFEEGQKKSFHAFLTLWTRKKKQPLKRGRKEFSR
jgi:hypothetical protein